MSFFSPIYEDHDSVFPGDNWFLYWRTSTSLWESKLNSINNSKLLFVPINWSVHEPLKNGHHDFGQWRPETNLFKLSKMAEGLNIELIFLLPLAPFPFFNCGGVPAYLANVLSQTEDGICYGIVNSENKINKIYSFFDHRIYKGFRKFLLDMADHLKRSSRDERIVGLIPGYCQNEKFHSYLEDTSNAFEQGFSRYLILKDEEEKVVINENIGFKKELENQRRHEFTSMIKNLYLSTAKEILKNNWCGEYEMAFLGGAPTDIFQRSLDRIQHSSNYFNKVFEILSLDVIPSYILLPSTIKRGILSKMIGELVDSNYFNDKFVDLTLVTDNSISFTPLNFFEIYSSYEDIKEDKSCLFKYLKKNYKHEYIIKKEIPGKVELENVQGKVFVFQDFYLSKRDFNKILTIFINGGQILLNENILNQELKNIWKTFLQENSIQEQHVNCVGPLINATIGEGVMSIFNAYVFNNLPLVKKVSFWETMVDYFNINNLKINCGENVFYFWKTREPYPHELQYEQIRRVSFYNPSSYKQMVNIIPSANFIFIKTLDEINVDVKWNENIVIELLPNGSLSFDFGYNRS